MPSDSPPANTNTPRLLALDTATDRLAIAVVHGDRVVSANEEGGARASARLLPLALSLLQEAGLAVRDLDAVAFGQGPGAFTGLRAAAAAAQGLALGAGLPVLAIDSLALVAEDHLPEAPVGTTVWVAMDARMDEIYAARYTRQGARWLADEAPALWPWAAFAEQLLSAPANASANAACVGSAWSVFADRLPALSSMAHGAHDLDRAGALARCALQAWQHGARLDAAQALPLYVRDKVAQTTDERAAAKRKQESPA